MKKIYRVTYGEDYFITESFAIATSPEEAIEIVKRHVDNDDMKNPKALELTFYNDGCGIQGFEYCVEDYIDFEF